MAEPPGRPLRVLFATPSYPPAYDMGGPMRTLEALAAHLRAAGTCVRVLTTDSHGPGRIAAGAGRRLHQGVPVHYLRRWIAPDATPAFLPHALAAARRVDVVHVTALFSTSSMLGLAGALAAGRPVVLSPRGALEGPALRLGLAGSKRAWLAAFGPLLRRVTLFHATSEAEAASVRRILGQRAPIRVVPNGAELEPVAAVRARRAHARGAVIGSVGRIHPIKRLERLIEAAALLRDQGLAFEVWIAGPTGDAAYRARLGEQVEAVGLGARVAFRGEVRGEAQRDFYAACRVLVLASDSENFGNVVVEALAHETPVVASRGTPWAELDERGCGRWVDNDAASLARAIEPYLRDAALAERAGRAGRALVEERYGWDRVAGAMRAVYAEAVALHGARAEA